LNIHYTTQFKKDYKRIKRQNRDLTKLETIVMLLVGGQPLDPKYKDHSLTGCLFTEKLIQICISKGPDLIPNCSRNKTFRT